MQNGSISEQYYYDADGHMITDADAGGNTLRAEIYAGSRHLATWNPAAGGTSYFNHADWLGTERVRTTASGSTYETCTSLPFGDGMSCSGPDPSPNHFTGLERDSETASVPNGTDGLDHTLNRQYPSNLGRWLTPDPAGEKAVRIEDPQTWNMYEYARNNPTTLTDPSGLWMEGCSPTGLSNSCTPSFIEQEASAAGEAKYVAKLMAAMAQEKNDPDKVGMAAEKKALRSTRRELKKHHKRVEYLGWMVRSKSDGSVTYTPPIPGGEGWGNLGPVPKGYTPIGIYHTHPYTDRAEGEGASPGDVYGIRSLDKSVGVDLIGYVGNQLSGEVYRYTQWEPVKGRFDPATLGTRIGNIPPED